MNNNGINLVLNKREIKPKIPINSRLGMFRLGAIIILFGSGAISIIVSILIVFSPLPQLQKDEQKARDRLAEYKLEISKLAFINDRGDSIRKILSERQYYDKRIEVIQNKIPAGVSFDSFSIEKNIYTLTFSSENLSSLNELLDAIVDLSGKKRDYSKIYLTSLSINDDNKKFVMVVDLLSV